MKQSIWCINCDAFELKKVKVVKNCMLIDKNDEKEAGG